MRGRYGTSVTVSNDIGERFAVLPADVLLTIDGEHDVLLDPATARRLAKKLKKHADKVEYVNRLRGFHA